MHTVSQCLNTWRFPSFQAFHPSQFGSHTPVNVVFKASIELNSEGKTVISTYILHKQKQLRLKIIFAKIMHLFCTDRVIPTPAQCNFSSWRVHGWYLDQECSLHWVNKNFANTKDTGCWRLFYFKIYLIAVLHWMLLKKRASLAKTYCFLLRSPYEYSENSHRQYDLQLATYLHKNHYYFSFLYLPASCSFGFKWQPYSFCLFAQPLGILIEIL